MIDTPTKDNQMEPNKNIFVYLYAYYVLRVVFLFASSSDFVELIFLAIYTLIALGLIYLTQKFKNRYFLLPILILNLLNFTTISSTFYYAIPVLFLTAEAYRLMSDKYKYIYSKKFEEKFVTILQGTSGFGMVGIIFLGWMWMAYIYWTVISGSFVQFVNPFNLIWVILSALKQPITYFLIYSGGTLGCLYFMSCFILENKFKDEECLTQNNLPDENDIKYI